jgi:hypothetical protein
VRGQDSVLSKVDAAVAAATAFANDHFEVV